MPTLAWACGQRRATMDREAAAVQNRVIDAPGVMNYNSYKMGRCSFSAGRSSRARVSAGFPLRREKFPCEEVARDPGLQPGQTARDRWVIPLRVADQ